jgi:multimeric flavodoxin WrbA
MRVLGISGSPRVDGNTDALVRLALEVLEQRGFETQLASLAEKPVDPCVACNECFTGETPRCARESPALEEYLEAIRAADGLLLGTPVYFGSATPQIVSLIGCVTYIARRTDNFLRHKVGAAVAVGRRAGHSSALAQLNHFLLRAEMIVPGSDYWAMAMGREKGDVYQDQEGLRSVRSLSRNMAWLLRRLEGNRAPSDALDETAVSSDAVFANGDRLLRQVADAWPLLSERAKVAIAQILHECPPVEPAQ